MCEETRERGRKEVCVCVCVCVYEVYIEREEREHKRQRVRARRSEGNHVGQAAQGRRASPRVSLGTLATAKEVQVRTASGRAAVTDRDSVCVCV